MIERIEPGHTGCSPDRAGFGPEFSRPPSSRGAYHLAQGRSRTADTPENSSPKPTFARILPLPIQRHWYPTYLDRIVLPVVSTMPEVPYFDTQWYGFGSPGDPEPAGQPCYLVRRHTRRCLPPRPGRPGQSHRVTQSTSVTTRLRPRTVFPVHYRPRPYSSVGRATDF